MVSIIGVHPELCRLQVLLINRIIPLEHRHGFIPGDLHRRQSIHSCTPQICRSGVAEIMKDSIRNARLLAHPREHVGDTCSLRIQGNR
jgi:hypothetical protein